MLNLPLIYQCSGSIFICNILRQKSKNNFNLNHLEVYFLFPPPKDLHTNADED